MGNCCSALFGGPALDENGNKVQIKNVAYINPGDRISKVNGWRDGKNAGLGNGVAVVSSIESVPEAHTRTFKIIFQGDEPDLVINAAAAYFKLIVD